MGNTHCVSDKPSKDFNKTESKEKSKKIKEKNKKLPKAIKRPSKKFPIDQENGEMKSDYPKPLKTKIDLEKEEKIWDNFHMRKFYLQKQVQKEIDPNEEEVWGTPPNFSKYRVSTLGRFKLQSGKISTVKPAKSGYVCIGCVDDQGKERKIFLHRLVALTFIPNPYNKPFVDHLNMVRHDCRVVNLRWVDAVENTENVSEPIKVSGKPVNQYDLDNTLIKQWKSNASICRNLKLKTSGIANACKNNIPYANFYWKYADSIDIEGKEWATVVMKGYTIKVSSAGRVETLSGFRTFGSPTSAGYLSVEIKRGIRFLVYRLICQAFYPIESPELYDVNHKDGDRTNNKRENLEFCSRSENILHAYKMKGEARNLLSVCQYTLEGEFIRRFDTIREVSKFLGDEKSNGVVEACEKSRYIYIKILCGDMLLKI